MQVENEQEWLAWVQRRLERDRPCGCAAEDRQCSATLALDPAVLRQLIQMVGETPGQGPQREMVREIIEERVYAGDSDAVITPNFEQGLERQVQCLLDMLGQVRAELDRRRAG